MAAKSRRLATILSTQIADQRVLRAVAAVPRELFVPPALRERAYDDSALPIGHGQTISQPLVVARMAELLEVQPVDRVLDVGTGSGYHAAVLAQLADHVLTIERVARLAATAIRSLGAAGATNVTCLVGDGAGAADGHERFDAINVAAAGAAPAIEGMAAALAPGGRLVAPLRRGGRQHLVHARRPADGGPCVWTVLEPVRFVPLVSGRTADETHER